MQIPRLQILLKLFWSYASDKWWKIIWMFFRSNYKAIFKQLWALKILNVQANLRAERLAVIIKSVAIKISIVKRFKEK